MGSNLEDTIELDPVGAAVERAIGYLEATIEGLPGFEMEAVFLDRLLRKVQQWKNEADEPAFVKLKVSPE